MDNQHANAAATATTTTPPPAAKTRPDTAALPPHLLRRLPFFFYGTLQTGYQNHAAVVRGRYSSVRRAQLPGALLVHYEAGWPGMTPTDDASRTVVGQLLTVDEPHDYAGLLADLDTLEGEWGRMPAFVRTVADTHLAARGDPGQGDRLCLHAEAKRGPVYNFSDSCYTACWIFLPVVDADCALASAAALLRQTAA